MSRYTTQYGTLYDTGFEPLLDALAEYPIYDSSHRADLNGKIYNRFRFREIGLETAALFAHYFRTTLLEIMPYYNEMYRTAAMDYDIFTDADYTETTEGTTDTTSSSSASSSGTSHGSHGHSETPQGSFDFSSVTQNQYLSDADVDDGSSSASSESSAETGAESSGSRHVVGKMPGMSRASMVAEYRKTILNIDRLILDDLESCFMGIY